MLFIVHVDYVIIPEVHHMTIDDNFRSPRKPRRRRQGQSWPDDVDDGFRIPRGLRHVLPVIYSFTKRYYS